jgi:hypothetical protein
LFGLRFCVLQKLLVLGRRKANAVVLLGALDDELGRPHRRPIRLLAACAASQLCLLNWCLQLHVWNMGGMIVWSTDRDRLGPRGVLVRRSGEGHMDICLSIKMGVRCGLIAEA